MEASFLYTVAAAAGPMPKVVQMGLLSWSPFNHFLSKRAFVLSLSWSVGSVLCHEHGPAPHMSSMLPHSGNVVCAALMQSSSVALSCIRSISIPDRRNVIVLSPNSGRLLCIQMYSSYIPICGLKEGNWHAECLCTPKQINHCGKRPPAHALFNTLQHLLIDTKTTGSILSQ